MKTQELYALVFATRYLDIFTQFVSVYNTVMKLIFLGSSFSIVWYIRQHKIVRRSYDKDQDTFRHYFLVLPCLVLALLINEKFTFQEVCASSINSLSYGLWLCPYFLFYIFWSLKSRIYDHTDTTYWKICSVYVITIFLCFIITMPICWTGDVGIFLIFGSCCHTSSACFVAKD